MLAQPCGRMSLLTCVLHQSSGSHLTCYLLTVRLARFPVIYIECGYLFENRLVVLWGFLGPSYPGEKINDFHSTHILILDLRVIWIFEQESVWVQIQISAITETYPTHIIGARHLYYVVPGQRTATETGVEPALSSVTGRGSTFKLFGQTCFIWNR